MSWPLPGYRTGSNIDVSKNIAIMYFQSNTGRFIESGLIDRRVIYQAFYVIYSK